MDDQVGTTLDRRLHGRAVAEQVVSVFRLTEGVREFDDRAGSSCLAAASALPRNRRTRLRRLNMDVATHLAIDTEKACIECGGSIDGKLAGDFP